MTRSSRAGAMIVVLALTVACSRSPQEFARTVSGLPIPDAAEVLAFQDDASGFLGQDLHTRAELQLDAPAFQKLMTEARGAGYVPLRSGDESEPDPANQSGMSAHGVAKARLAASPDADGLFRYVRDTPSSYSLVVLDAARLRVIVEVLIV